MAGSSSPLKQGLSSFPNGVILMKLLTLAADGQHHHRVASRWLGSCLAAVAILCTAAAASAQNTSNNNNNVDTNPPGIVSLTQPTVTTVAETIVNAPPPPYVPTDFENYVDARRLGARLITSGRGPGSSQQDSLAIVPDDYIIKPGDEINVALWGAVDADLHLVVNRSGQINLPRVGAVQVAGVRHADLADLLRRRVSQVFKNFQLSASLGQLRAIRVFVTGFVQSPGSLTVSSLSSVLHVLMRAGGPSPAGSFRDITLRRNGKVIGRYDLYDLLLKGERGADQIVEADDVIHIGPIGQQVALLGSVNQPGVFELKTGETLADVFAMAGGFTTISNRTRVSVEKLSERFTGRVSELTIADGKPGPLPVTDGDIYRVFASTNNMPSTAKHNLRVRLDGEFVRSGDYLLPPGSTLRQAVQAAGGLTSRAFLYGAEFNRNSARKDQQENYQRAILEVESNMLREQASQGAMTNTEASAARVAEAANSRLLSRLRALQPTGRMVLGLAPNATELPDIPLEEGDRLYVPTAPSSIGVFGSVYSPGNFLFVGDKTLGDYVAQAGKDTQGAEVGSAFVIHADGSVTSARQVNALWGMVNNFDRIAALPGDTVFVPQSTTLTNTTQVFKDWTQIIYQFGLGVAGIKALGL